MDTNFTLAASGKLTNSGGTVYIEETFTNTGTLSGSKLGLGYAVLYGGTVQGGAATPSGLAFSSKGGVLSGVTYDGTLDLSGNYDYVNLAGGTVVNNAAGTGAGTINDTGLSSYLYFDGTQTFDNATINLGNKPTNPSSLYEYDSTGAGTVLTLGSNVTIDESGSAEITVTGYAGDGVVNQGKINQTASDSTLNIAGQSVGNSHSFSFTNSGTITAASSGGKLTIDATTFTNSGPLAASNGDAVTIEASNFSNTGSITLASGASLYMDTNFTLAASGKLTNSGGTVYIEETFTNTGTLSGSSGLGYAVLYGGTVQGGAATPSGLAFSSKGGVLSGVTYDGTLDLSGNYDYVNLAGGTVVNNAAGTGAGTINDTGLSSYLYFDGTQTFDNATINLGNKPTNPSSLYEYDSTGAGTVLTLGSNVTIDESGSAEITVTGYAGDGVVNQGKINQTASDSTLNIAGQSVGNSHSFSFTNSGTITAASSGGKLTIDATTFTNSGPSPPPTETRSPSRRVRSPTSPPIRSPAGPMRRRRARRLRSIAPTRSPPTTPISF